MPHSCRVVDLDSHFERSTPDVRAAFDAFLAAASRAGPVIVNATVSRISIQARMRFAGVQRPGRRHLVAGLVLTRPVQGPPFDRVEYIPPYYYLHRVRLERAADVTPELVAYLAEAARVGRQEHVGNRRFRKVRVPPDGVALPREVRDAIARGEDPSKAGLTAKTRRRSTPPGE